MEMELNQIFARCRIWTGKDKNQRLIQYFLRLWRT
jgi:hypothetical protein